jgi:hypothetical protein
LLPLSLQIHGVSPDICLKAFDSLIRSIKRLFQVPAFI